MSDIWVRPIKYNEIQIYKYSLKNEVQNYIENIINDQTRGYRMHFNFSEKYDINRILMD